MKFQSLKDHAAVIAVCVAFFILGLFRLNDLSLYTDSTRYVIWGTSLSQGKGFIDDTMPEPERYVVNAPLYSVVLAPAMLVAPLSIVAAKTWTLLWGVLALVLFYRWLVVSVGKTAAIFCTAFLALNPLMIVISTEALSEAPFLAIMALALLLFERWSTDESQYRRTFLILVPSLALLVLLREISAAFVLAAVLFLFARRRYSFAINTILATGVLFGLWTLRNFVLVGVPQTSQSPNVRFILEHYVTSPDAPLYRELLLRSWFNLKGFAFELTGLLLYLFPTNLIVDPTRVFRATYRFFQTAKYFIPVVFLPATAWGMVLDFRKSQTALLRIMFLLIYLVVVVTYPIHDIRFLLPLIPLALFYGARTALWAGSTVRMGQLVRNKIPFTAFVLVFFLPNVLCVGELLWTNYCYLRSPLELAKVIKSTRSSNEYFTQPWSRMGAWIRENLPERATIAGSAKEIVTFIGNRLELEINNGVPLPMFEALVRDNGAEYVMATTLWGNFRAYDFHMKESRRFWFEPLHSEVGLHLLKVHSVDQEGPPPPAIPPDPADSLDATPLMELGRQRLLDERYSDAVNLFKRAQLLAPGEASIRFQLLVTYALQGDSVNAMRSRDVLFIMPRSTPYVWAARSHLTVMNLFLAEQRTSSNPVRAQKLFDISSWYWNLGYRKQAYSLARRVVELDPEFFTGLLWAWHYGIQLGDTTSAASYLRTLERIDAANVLVSSFRRMTRLSDTLRRRTSPAERCRIRLAIAHEYDKMELPEEALDETSRAIREEPSNIVALLFLADLFEKKQKPIAAKKVYEDILRRDPNNAFVRSKLFGD